MAFVLTIVFLLLLLLYCANDKANKTNRISSYYKDHPPCKYQEEYLLACEYYHKYLFDGESEQDAYGHALKSARIDIYNNGYLPTCFESAGLSCFDQDAPIMERPVFFWGGEYQLEPHDPPNGLSGVTEYNIGYIKRKLLGLMTIRKKETNFAFCSTDLRTTEYKSDQKWKAYCDQLDAKFDALVIQSLVDYGIVDGEIHEGEAYIMDAISANRKPLDYSKCKTREFKTKWIDYNQLEEAPWLLRDIIHRNGPEYEKILELHKDELPQYLAKKRERQPTKQKEEPTTPYGR